MVTKRRALERVHEFQAMLPDLDELEASWLLTELQGLRRSVISATWKPYPWQIPPGDIETHGAWLMLGGRGTGKTEGAARYVDDHATGPPCDRRIAGGHRMAIVAPTLGDAADACFYGPSGLHTINPATRMKGGAGGTHVHWPNKATARIFGCYTQEDVERLRAGGNRCLVWFEELAAQRLLKQALEHTAFGLRIGPSPHFVMSTTPKPRPELKELIKDPRVQITKGRTAEAVNLDPSVREELFAKYGGTRIGRQELDAEILDDVEGAMWKVTTLDLSRFMQWNADEPWLSLAANLTLEARLSMGLGEYRPAKGEHRPWETWVGVDPPGETAECGIVVGMAPKLAKAGYDHAVILDDLSVAGPPEVWGARVVQAIRKYGAVGAVVESNQGGDMTRATIHAADPTVVVEKIRAKDSKADRAQPISGLYAQGWIHHYGHLVQLEEQMTTWVEDESKSPDRMDALVHLCTKLLRPVVVARQSSVGSSLVRRSVA
jgi:phage terminase large subunit-like protein